MGEHVPTQMSCESSGTDVEQFRRARQDCEVAAGIRGFNVGSGRERQPLVTVVLPCRNEARHIEDCLKSIFEQQEPEGGFEIIIADGMSDDGTREVIRRMQDGSQKPEVSGQLSVVSCPVIRVIDNPGRTVSQGLNAAIRAARGQVIVRMDAHTEYAPDYIRCCLETLNETGADNVGGPARTKAETSTQKANAAAYHSPFSAGGARFHDVNYEGCVDTVTYGCWPRSTFEKFGLFDEELVRNQDDEHNLRITRGGGKIYQSPKIRSWYRPRASLTGLFRQYLQYGYWKVRVMQKHKRLASWRHLVPAAFVLVMALLFLISVFYCLAAAFYPLSPVPNAFASWLLRLELGAYGVAMLLACVHTAWKTEWKLLPVLPMVFYCYHFGYGYGYVKGMWDFVIRRNGAQKSFQTLTR